MEEKFLLVSLREDEAKQLAQVISNNTSRRILDYLANVRDCTETDLAKKLGLPLSTVHYNMQALLKAKLVQANEFHYSNRGKEVQHYSLAGKYVIIAPKEAPQTLRQKLARILTVALLSGSAALAIGFFGRKKEPAMLRVAESAEMLSAPAAQEASLALWFLAGALFAILAFVAVDYIQRKNH